MQKYRDRNGRCIAILFKSIGVRGRFDSPDKLHCNIEKAALQESGAFLPLSCGFQAPTFRHPRLGPADKTTLLRNRPFLPVRVESQRKSPCAGDFRSHGNCISWGLNWVHANGGIINGGVACVCAEWRVFAHFCAFLHFFVHFCVPKWPAEKRKFAHNRAKMCKKALLCNTPFSYTPFSVSLTQENRDVSGSGKHRSRNHRGSLDFDSLRVVLVKASKTRILGATNSCTPNSPWAALQGNDLKGQTPICGFLLFSSLLDETSCITVD